MNWLRANCSSNQQYISIRHSENKAQFEHFKRMGAKKSKKRNRADVKNVCFKPNDPRDEKIRLLQQQVEQLKSQRNKGDCSASEGSNEKNHADSAWPAHNTSAAGIEHLYALLEEEKYNELLSIASNISDEHPHIGEIAYVIGLAHTRLNNPEQALIAYQIAQSSDFLTPFVLHNAAEACRLIRNGKEAIRLYKEALGRGF